MFTAMDVRTKSKPDALVSRRGFLLHLPMIGLAYIGGLLSRFTSISDTEWQLLFAHTFYGRRASYAG